MHLRFVVPLDVDRPTGGNVYDLALAAALRSQGDRVDVVSCSPADLALQAPGPGLVLIDGLLASDQPDVVRACRSGVLVHMPLAWRDPAAAAIEAEALRAARVVVATSHWTAKFLRETYAVEAIVAPPGVDLAPVEPGSDPPLSAHVAAVVHNKNQLAVVRALAGLTELPWRARLVGSMHVEPSYADRVRAEIDTNGLTDRIEMPGELPRDQAFAGANLVLLPSRVEAYGMVVTEALARGIPAIVSPGGPEEALGKTSQGEIPGVVLSPGVVEPSSFVEPGLFVEPVETTLETALRDWLTNPALRADLRRRALTRRTELTGWAVAAKQLSEALAGRTS